MQQEQIDFGLVAETEAKKRCSTCGKRLSLDAFARQLRNRSGVTSVCKVCTSAYDKIRHAKFRKQNEGRVFTGEKYCRKCKRMLAMGMFSPNKNMPDGASVWCRKCEQVRTKQRYLSLHGQLINRLCSARIRAKKAGIPFDIDGEFVFNLWDKQQGFCAVSGLPMVPDNPKGGTAKAPYRPSLDKIDSKLGYVDGNVRLVVTLVNLAINDWGEEEFKKVCRAVVEKEIRDKKE